MVRALPLACFVTPRKELEPREKPLDWRRRDSTRSDWDTVWSAASSAVYREMAKFVAAEGPLARTTARSYASAWDVNE